MGKIQNPQPWKKQQHEIIDVDAWDLARNSTDGNIYQQHPTFETLDNYDRRNRKLTRITGFSRKKRVGIIKKKKKNKTKANKYPNFDQLRHLYDLDRSTRTLKNNKKKSNRIDLT